MKFKSYLLILLLLQLVKPLYFQLEEGDEKCFYEEVAENQLILSSYDLLEQLKEQLNNPSAGLQVTVYDYQNNIIA